MIMGNQSAPWAHERRSNLEIRLVVGLVRVRVGVPLHRGLLVSRRLQLLLTSSVESFAKFREVSVEVPGSM